MPLESEHAGERGLFIHHEDATSQHLEQRLTNNCQAILSRDRSRSKRSKCQWQAMRPLPEVTIQSIQQPIRDHRGAIQVLHPPPHLGLLLPMRRCFSCRKAADDVLQVGEIVAVVIRHQVQLNNRTTAPHASIAADFF